MSRTPRPERLTRRIGVLPVAVGLIALQLAYRAWTATGSGWVGDDFVMMDRVFEPGGHTLSALVASYAGHVIPGTLYLTWLITRAAAYDFTLAAAAMVAMQALAALGLLRFLVNAFGRRWGILPPLVLYLVSPFVVAGTVWWTPGSHHFMLQAAFAWAMSCQLTYLRTRRWRSAVYAVVWVLVGLVFFEKTLLVIGALAFLTVAYFTEGDARSRVAQVWRRYRFSVVANLLLGVGYLVVYVRYGLSFSPTAATHTPIGPVVDVMVLRSWAPGIFGGPLTWTHGSGTPTSFADPSGLVVLVSVVLLALFVRELARTRTCALRSLVLPGYFLGCDVLLVVAGRAGLVGPAIGFEFRYLSELSIVTACALALATLPITGAVEQVGAKRPSALLDHPRRVTVACLAITMLAVYSTTTYVAQWNRGRSTEATWVDHLLDDARALPRNASVIDSPAPDYVAWPISYPANLVSHLLRPLRPDLRFTGVGSETLRVVDTDGRIRPAAVTQLRRNLPGHDENCGYRVAHRAVRIPLDGPVVFGGTWVRISYIASGDSAVRVAAGGASHRTSVSRGLHLILFKAGDQRFDSIRIGGLIGSAQLCTDDVVVGLPRAREGR